MAVYTEGIYLNELLKWEQDKAYSRELVMLASGSLSMGAVIGLVTATSMVVEWNPDATDGSETIYGFLIADADASGGPVNAVAIVRDAIIVPGYLVWSAGITDMQKVTAMAQFNAKGIVTRWDGTALLGGEETNL